MSKRNANEPGKLYIVATPIGNLEDMTYRAIRVMSEADLVAAEDTRSAKILYSRYAINTPLTSYHAANQKRQTPYIVEKLMAGQNVALITEAGTPGVSDPGHLLVAKAIEMGITVVPIPGACAAIAAVMASGMPSYVFTFYGFIPPKGGKRRKAFTAISEFKQPVVLYESPHRIMKTLLDIRDHLGDRDLIIGREMTKIHEEFLRLKTSEAIVHFTETEPRGEFVVIVMPADPSSSIMDEEEDSSDNYHTEE